MATDADFVAHVAEQAGLGEALSYRKMFGEYVFYLDGKVVALACDNSVFIKLTPAAQSLGADCPLHPPYAGARPLPRIDALLDEPDTLRSLLQATAAALPVPKPKAPRKSRKKKS